MSREFGLDWKEYDFARMNAFIELLRLENKRQDMDNKKQSNKSKSHNNYR